jgi:hypothetical protein
MRSPSSFLGLLDLCRTPPPPPPSCCWGSAPGLMHFRQGHCHCATPIGHARTLTPVSPVAPTVREIKF